jgi:hypothetical protein
MGKSEARLPSDNTILLSRQQHTVLASVTYSMPRKAHVQYNNADAPTTPLLLLFVLLTTHADAMDALNTTRTRSGYAARVNVGWWTNRHVGVLAQSAGAQTSPWSLLRCGRRHGPFRPALTRHHPTDHLCFFHCQGSARTSATFISLLVGWRDTDRITQ